MFEMVDGLRMDSTDPRKQKAEELAAKLMEDEDAQVTEPENFLAFAIPAYFEAMKTPSYLFSSEELLWIAEQMQVNIVIATTHRAHFEVEGYELGHAGPIAIVSSRAEGQRRVRSHFEQLYLDGWCVEATAAKKITDLFCLSYSV